MLSASIRHRLSERQLRDVDLGTLQDAFLIMAAGTIIVIRLQLWATNYPKLGGGGLHLAHLLWGGVFMLTPAAGESRSGWLRSTGCLRLWTHDRYSSNRLTRRSACICSMGGACVKPGL